MNALSITRFRWITKPVFLGVAFAALLTGSLASPATAVPPPKAPTITLHSIPTADSRPAGITRAMAGPSGTGSTNMWFTESAANNIAEITPSGEITEYPIPTPNSTPVGITHGAFGDLWFTENTADKIGTVDPANGHVTEYAVPTPGSLPGAIAPDPETGYLFFTEAGSNKIGRLVPSTGDITEYPIPTADSGVSGITGGVTGMWFTESTADKIGLINPFTGAITEYDIPATANSDPNSIAVGPDGAVWFTQNATNEIGRLDPSTRAVTEYPIPTADASPGGATVGPDGNIWFTELAANKLAEITNRGDITEYPIPAASGPMGLATDSAGNLWFTGWGANNIGELTPAPSKAPVSCGNPVSNEYAGLILDAINGDLLVDGYCHLGLGARVNGDVKVVPGGSLLMYDGATVDGNVRSNGGRFDSRGANVSGNIDISNVPDGYNAEIIYVNVGGNVTINRVPGAFFLAGAVDATTFSIAGNVTISNIGGLANASGDHNVFRGYRVGGNVTLRNVGGANGELTGNTISGDLICRRVLELSTWTVSNNTVGGTNSCNVPG